MLVEYWNSPSDTQFFAKAILQPYMRLLAESGGHPFNKGFENSERRCPFCGGMPQVSFLKIKEATSESGNRDLVCAPARITGHFDELPAHMRRRGPTKLGYFHTPEYTTSESKLVIPASATLKVASQATLLTIFDRSLRPFSHFS
jgi:hypothetical protein